MFHFCTYFDERYLSRFLALHYSLTQHVPKFCIWALCMDNTAYQVMLQAGLQNVRPISIEEFEKNDLELQSAKQNRSQVEYYFTCTPSLPLYIFGQDPGIDLITYLDADLYFFSDVSPIFEEIGDHSIAIIKHRFPSQLSYLEDRGIFNVGWLSFRRDEIGIACLQQWRNQCIEWCYDRVEDGRYADQKYLDKWPNIYSNLTIIRHQGANLAPWNIQNYRFSENDGELVVDGKPLIFYHFQGLLQTKSWLYHSGFRAYEMKPPSIIKRVVYARYIEKLIHYQQNVQGFLNETHKYSIRVGMPVSNVSTKEKWTNRIRNLLVGEYIIYLKEPLGLVIF